MFPIQYRCQTDCKQLLSTYNNRLQVYKKRKEQKSAKLVITVEQVGMVHTLPQLHQNIQEAVLSAMIVPKHSWKSDSRSETI